MQQEAKRTIELRRPRRRRPARLEEAMARWGRRSHERRDEEGPAVPSRTAAIVTPPCNTTPAAVAFKPRSSQQANAAQQ